MARAAQLAIDVPISESDAAFPSWKAPPDAVEARATQFVTDESSIVIVAQLMMLTAPPEAELLAPTAAHPEMATRVSVASAPLSRAIAPPFV